MTKKRVCVFAGSRMLKDAALNAACAQLGAEIGKAGFDVVYGANDAGMMDVVARAAHLHGAEITGVTPRLWASAVPDYCTRLFVQEGPINDALHERKKIMLAESDIFLAVPGAKGTEDEIVTMLTWRDFGVHSKAIVVWDPPLEGSSFFAGLRQLTDTQFNSGLLDPKYRDFISYHADIHAVVAALKAA
jgi:uncharacterized protein (TIGR00730 family)